MVKSLCEGRGFHSNLLTSQRWKSKLFMSATRSLNQTAQCEVMAWKSGENCLRTPIYRDGQNQGVRRGREETEGHKHSAKAECLQSSDKTLSREIPQCCEIFCNHKSVFRSNVYRKWMSRLGGQSQFSVAETSLTKIQSPHTHHRPSLLLTCCPPLPPALSPSLAPAHPSSSPPLLSRSRHSTISIGTDVSSETAALNR